MGEMTVPLVDLGNGRWGSPSPAWNHLINRESSGNPTIIQQIVDVNSGGNEAEGLFQITPRTWRTHNGTDFAPSARLATPQQQAIVAARIFTRNPTGSDWGAGRPGRENPRDLAAGLVPLDAPAPTPAPPVWVPQPYGMPTGSNSGGYGGGGVRFPDWVYALGNAFGVKPSTYPGHQESDRNEAGYAPNPAHLNRGIDWAAPGAPDEVNRMQRFADYLFLVRGELEQVIWWNPQTDKRIGVAGGKDVTTTPYYDYPGGYDDHRDHVHTRQSHSIPLPGGAPVVIAPPAPAGPQFTEIEMFNGRNNSSVRSRKPINFFIHTQEGPPGREISDASAKDLAEYCQGQNGVSYHYTIRDGIVYDVVDTDYYSWSVLSANVFSINLCFAGSSVKLTRQQWLEKYGRDIDIAAYLAVQDCRKYGMSTEVLVPDWARSGGDTYAGGPRSGISDHNYVTRELGIGDHQDVGRNFPWDVFVAAVNKYANPTTTPGDDMALVPQDQWDRFYAAYMGDQPSESPFRPLEQGSRPLAPVSQFVRWSNGGSDFQDKKDLAVLGHQPTIDLLNRIAAADPSQYPDRQKDAALARNVLAAAQKAWATTSAPASTAVVVTEAAVDASAPALAAANAEIARLRDENARLRAEAAVAAVSTAVAPVNGSTDGTLGQRVGQFVDAVGQLNLADAAPIEERATLAASIKVLETKNGSSL